jgi:hypothetical protein
MRKSSPLREVLQPSFADIKTPVQPSGFAPGRNWDGAGSARQAISGMLGSDCFVQSFVIVLVVKVRGHVVIFISSGTLCKTSTAE